MNKKAYIKLLTNAMYDVQSVRKAVDNRIMMFSKASDEESKEIASEMQTMIAKKLHDTENSIADSIAKHVKDVPIMIWLEKVSGIGPRLGGSLIGTIGELPDTVSQLWAYCGMATIPICLDCNRIAYLGEQRIKFCVNQSNRRWEQNQKKKDPEKKENEESFKRNALLDSESKLCKCKIPNVKNLATAPKYFAGLLLNYNPFLKMTCWKITGQFVRQGKFYRTVYEQSKAKYSADTTLTKLHAENRARRYTVKLFLSHLHEMWSKSEGRGVKEFYYKAFGDFSGHTYIDPPYSDIYG